MLASPVFSSCMKIIKLPTATVIEDIQLCISIFYADLCDSPVFNLDCCFLCNPLLKLGLTSTSNFSFDVIDDDMTDYRDYDDILDDYDVMNSTEANISNEVILDSTHSPFSDFAENSVINEVTTIDDKEIMKESLDDFLAILENYNLTNLNDIESGYYND